MIVFRQRTVWQRIKRLLPYYRRQQDAALEAAIAKLVADSALPCEVEGVVIPHGYGSPLFPQGPLL